MSGETARECDECGQGWTEGELDEEGAVGEWLWECPGCHALHPLDD